MLGVNVKRFKKLPGVARGSGAARHFLPAVAISDPLLRASFGARLHDKIPALKALTYGLAVTSFVC